MKRKITFRKAFLIIFFTLQVVGIIIAKFTDTKYFCWAPYDEISFYEMSVTIDGNELSNDEIRNRYGYGKTGRENRSIYNLKSIIRQYEQTYASDENTTIEIAYIINGHKKKTWIWPEDETVSR